MKNNRLTFCFFEMTFFDRSTPARVGVYNERNARNTVPTFCQPNLLYVKAIPVAHFLDFTSM